MGNGNFAGEKMPKFVPRQKKQKRRPKDSQPGVSQGDSNATEIIPVSKDEKEERKRQLREEWRVQQPKISSKKQKRFDKYIVRVDLFFPATIHGTPANGDCLCRTIN